MTTKQIGRVTAFTISIVWGTAIYIPGFAQSTDNAPTAGAKTGISQAVPWKPKYLSDGQPDIQGIWLTVYYGFGCLTNPTDGDVNCVPPPGPRPIPGTVNAGGPPPPNPQRTGQRGNGNPPSIVNEESTSNAQGNGGQQPGARPPRRVRNAPSRIIDTVNHDIPYTPEALAHQQDLFAHYYVPTRYGDIDPQQRCWPLGAVRQLTWHDVQILQYPQYIILVFEGAEQYRIIYLDNRPHIGNDLKLWFGDSRGHWKGTTLVVDTTNNNAKGRLSQADDFSSDKVRYIERFRFTDANHFRYEATFDDPSVYTRKWTFSFDEKRGYFAGDGGTPAGPVNAETQAKYENWEEACHEGLIPGENDIRVYH